MGAIERGRDQPRQGSRERVTFIDVLKGIFTLSMIYGHVVCLLGVKDLSPARAITALLSVATFPGFLFCFGYVSEMAYFSRSSRRSSHRMLANGIRIMIAYYISAIAYRLLLSETGISASSVLRILGLLDVPPYSEFLLSFALYMVLSAALLRPVNWLLQRPLVFWPTIAAMLMAAFIPYDKITSTHLGILVGTTEFNAFPVVQFAPFFLLGAFFRRHQLKVDTTTVLIAAASSSVLVISYTAAGEAPSMYPPSLPWLLGSPLPLCAAYAGAKALAARPGAVTAVLTVFGQNALFCLIASNLMLFALATVWPGHVLEPHAYVPLAVALCAIIYYLLSIVYRHQRADPQ